MQWTGGKDFARGTNFTCMATSGAGHVVVGSRDGKIRLYSSKTLTQVGVGGQLACKRGGVACMAAAQPKAHEVFVHTTALSAHHVCNSPPPPWLHGLSLAWQVERGGARRHARLML